MVAGRRHIICTSLCLTLVLSLTALAADTNAPASGGAETNAPVLKAVGTNEASLRDKPSRARLEKEMNGSRDLSLRMLDGTPAMDRPLNPTQPRLTSEQARKLKERLDEQRYWMYNEPSATNQPGSLGTKDEEKEGDLKELKKPNYTEGLPKPLQRFFERADAKSNSTNATRLDDRQAEFGRSPLDGSGSVSRVLLGASAGNPIPTGESSGAIAHLFQAPPSTDRPLVAPSALSTAAGVAPANSLGGLPSETKLTSLRSYSQAESAAPLRSSLAPQTSLGGQVKAADSAAGSLAGMSVLSGMVNPAAPPTSPSLSSPGSGMSAPAPAALSQPIDFAPMQLPKRRF